MILRTLIASTMLCAWSGAAWAQQVPVQATLIDGGAPVGASNPLHVTGGGTPSSPSSVVVQPYGYTPLSPGQHNLAITTAGGVALTVPSGATYATVQAATAQVKYTTDGTTAPTSTVGQTLAAGATVALSGPTVLANFKAISATGTLDVEYFK